jgi:adenylate kinase
LELQTSVFKCFSRYITEGFKERDENLEAEIMGVVIDEARGSYSPDILLELPSNTIDEMEANVERVKGTLARLLQSPAG